MLIGTEELTTRDGVTELILKGNSIANYHGSNSECRIEKFTSGTPNMRLTSWIEARVMKATRSTIIRDATKRLPSHVDKENIHNVDKAVHSYKEYYESLTFLGELCANMMVKLMRHSINFPAQRKGVDDRANLLMLTISETTLATIKRSSMNAEKCLVLSDLKNRYAPLEVTQVLNRSWSGFQALNKEDVERNDTIENKWEQFLKRTICLNDDSTFRQFFSLTTPDNLGLVNKLSLKMDKVAEELTLLVPEFEVHYFPTLRPAQKEAKMCDANPNINADWGPL